MQYSSYSVLMSVYFRENPEHLKNSIDSIFNQTLSTEDLVLVCDGALTRELDDVVEYYENKYPDIFSVIRLEKNMGLDKALSEGIKICKNEIVARMDTDDYAYPERCQMQLEIINSGVDIVGGTVREMTSNMEDTGIYRTLPEFHDDIEKFARRRNPFNHPTVMFRKSKVEQAGGYKPFYLCEDYYLWVRMLMKGCKAYNIQDVLLDMRAGNEMYNRRSGYKYLKSMISFRFYMKKIGFSGNTDFVLSCLGQIVSTMVPNSIRKYIYKKFLRKNANIKE